MNAFYLKKKDAENSSERCMIDIKKNIYKIIYIYKFCLVFHTYDG